MQSPRSVCDLIYSEPIATLLHTFNHSQLSAPANYTDSESLNDLETLSSRFDILDPVSPQICQVIHVIIYYVPPVLFIMGTFGNVLSFLVLSRRSVLYPSSYIYLAVLALVDECVLLVGLFRQWTDRLAGRRLEDRHWVLCKVLNFTGVTASCLSVWIIVAVTVERALVIILPLHSTQAKRMKRSKITLLCLTLTIVGIASHFFVTVDIVNMYSAPVSTGTESTTYDSDAENNYLIPSYSTVSADMLQVCEFRKPFRDNGLRGVWIWVDATLYSYLPFILITIFNVIILINLHEANRRRVTLAAHWSQNARTPQTQPSLLMRGWLSISSLCPCHQREHELPRRRVCQFCAQSFPIDRFHESPGLLPNANRVCVSATYSNSPFLLHTLSQPISQERWPARAYTPAVNIKFGACHLNGYEIKTVNVERRSRPAVTSEVRQLTVLLLLISGTFLITTAPVVIVKLVIGRLDDRSASRLVQIELLDYIAEILMYINHAANFYLYLVAGPRFRREIRKLFHMRRYLRPHGRAGFGRPRRQKPKRYF